MYDPQIWEDGPAGNTPITAAALEHIEEGLELVSSKGLYLPRNAMYGTPHAEVPVFTAGAAADATFNESYVLSGSVPPTPWPVDVWGDIAAVSGLWAAKSSVGSTTVATHRVMTDGTDFSWYTAGGYEADLFIDGQPYANNPLVTAVTAGFGGYGFQKLVFATARPRLLELRTFVGFASLYTKKPYRVWKPAQDSNPKIAVVGDSYVYPITLSNTAAAGFIPDPWLRGLWNRMPAHLGISSLVGDGLGGSGYIAPGTSSKAYPHIDRLSWLYRIQPDVIVVHGGGANDLFYGNSVAAIVDAAATYFNTLRTYFPKAKLVFMEGIAPPNYTPAAYNANYILIREGLQAALADLSGVYYIDMATTRPPIAGTGYVLATTGVGNSDIYVGYDGLHLTEKGAAYLRGLIAPRIRRVLADHNGALEGSLIY